MFLKSFCDEICVAFGIDCQLCKVEDAERRNSFLSGSGWEREAE